MSIKPALNQSSLFRFTAKDFSITGDECSDLLKISHFHCPIYQLSLIRQHCVATKVLFLAPRHKTTKIHDFLSLLCAQWPCSLPTWVGLPGWHTFFLITTPSSRDCIGISACANFALWLPAWFALSWETQWPLPALAPMWGLSHLSHPDKPFSKEWQNRDGWPGSCCLSSSISLQDTMSWSCGS